MNPERKRQTTLISTELGFTVLWLYLACLSGCEENRQQLSTLTPPQPPGESSKGRDLLPTLPSVKPETRMEELVNQIEEEGYNCEPIPKGSWLTQELRKRGAPGIDEGPYKIIRRGGKVETFETYDQLPNLVYPGEQFCIKENGSSSIIPGKNHGVIFEWNNMPFVRTQNRAFQQKSQEITSRLRAKQRF